MPPAPAAHATHDPLAIAAYAAGDATGGELTAASALVATCEACAALHHDLRAIALALPATTAPAPRPRDFRLTPDQAASLTPTGWRRLLAPFAGPSFGFAKPLGTGLATLGLTGILVAGASGIPLGGATAMPADQASGGGAVAMQAPAASAAASAEDQLYEYNAAGTEAPAAGDGGPGPVPGASVLDDREAATDDREAATDDRGGMIGTGPAVSKAPDDPGSLAQGGGAAPEASDENLTIAGQPVPAVGDPGAAESDPGANARAPLAPAVPPTAWLGGAALLALVLGFGLLMLRWTARRLV